jgi:hypothetical protein
MFLPRETWPVDHPASRALINRPLRQKKTWLAELAAWKTWLNTSPIVKSSDWRRMRGQKHLFGWTPDVKKSDWTKVRAQKYLIGQILGCLNLIGQFKGPSIWLVHFSINVILSKRIASTNSYTHRFWDSIHDLWTRTVRVFSILNPNVENVFLTFEPDQDHVFSTYNVKVEKSKKMFFWPLTLTPTHKLFYFFHMTLPTVEGTKKEMNNTVSIIYKSLVLGWQQSFCVFFKNFIFIF